jgi:hypothetical protein
MLPPNAGEVFVLMTMLVIRASAAAVTPTSDKRPNATTQPG